MSSVFQKKFSFDKRKQENLTVSLKSFQIKSVIVEQGKSDKLVKIDKSKFLVLGDITVGQFMTIIEREFNYRSMRHFFFL